MAAGRGEFQEGAQETYDKVISAAHPEVADVLHQLRGRSCGKPIAGQAEEMQARPRICAPNMQRRMTFHDCGQNAETP